MINNKIRDFIATEHDDAVVFNVPSYDNAIIGITDSHVVYDFDLMIKEYMNEHQVTEIEACEYLEYNVIRTLPYIEESVRPVIMFHSKTIEGIKERELSYDSEKTKCF